MDWSLGLFVALLWFWSLIGPVWSAETHSSPATSKTQLLIKLATDEALAVRSRFQDSPPTIIVEFPSGRITGTLPERSVIQRGVIEAIQTVYGAATKPAQARWVRALKIQLRGPYDYQVRTQPGRIIIEIEHPASMAGEDVELGLTGAAMIAGTHQPAFSERFRAMQEALNRAQPQSWVWRASSIPTAPPRAESQSLVGRPLPRSSPRSALSSAPASSQPSGRPTMPAQGAADPFARWLWLLGGVGFAGLAGTLWLWRRQVLSAAPRRVPGGQPALWVPSGIRIIDQLVWRAFERQGHQLLHMVELGEPLGLMRIMVKDGVKAALLCVGDGAFFEKTTVEQFLQSIRKAKVEQGFLVAPGSFTVPAQRCAKEHGVTLIGRDQLTQLLSEGAISEYYTKQIQQLHKQLEDAQETLSEYGRQLDTLRRQRNEASWFLGEERAKTAKLEAQASELNQQIRHWQAQAEQWQQTADASRKQWEESQWYLGEAKTSGRYLDEQLRALHAAHGQLAQQHRDMTAKYQEIERQRDEANWYLGESRATHETLHHQIQELAEQLVQARGSLEEMRRSLDESQQRVEAERSHRRALEAELIAVRTYGERRRAFRIYRPDVTLEVQQADGAVVFRGIPHDMSRTGFGFAAEQLLHPVPDLLQVLLYLPASERPVEATSRLVWQRQDAANGHYPSGCEFLDMAAEGRATLEQTLTHPT